METDFATLIADLEKLLADLKAEAEVEAEAETYSELPCAFEREAAIDFLKKPNEDNLDDAFFWNTTPQGHDYWRDLSEDLRRGVKGPVPIEAKFQIQAWVIQSYIEEYGV
jgi:hypothetical protein